jgi:L-alanine-DL-glutamate epimerase-like enolase superfamily enzyme
VDYWLGRVTPEHAKKCIERARAMGFRGVKLKTSLEDPNVERLEAIKEAGGDDWHVTVDANGRFYRLEDALPTLRAMDRVGNMAIIEDPFPRFDFDDFVRLRSHLQARVAVHLDPPQSIWTVLKSGAAGALNIDSAKGLYFWRLLAATAESANVAICGNRIC